MKWDKEIERKIQEAMESGAFDNLPGKGEPLSIDQNPHEDPDWALAFHILKSNEFTLPWVERKRAIERKTEAARLTLRRAQESFIHGDDESFAASGRAVTAFREQAVEINREIRSYNLQVPLAQLQLAPIKIDREIQNIQENHS